ncbi:MAG TPA: type II toxin-antitoxin system RelE/ParE family toxin [Balneolales bacterium]|nr:type II toxin-antitoxin system RelE/ParE family toxin [Balneolales bacterium]
MRKLAFKLDEAAEGEFYNIIDYYKQFDKSLSSDFIYEFDRAVKHLQKFPDAGSPYLHNTKLIILHRFPYAIVYKIYRNKVIVVHAVMHMKRKPDYWKGRLK